MLLETWHEAITRISFFFLSKVGMTSLKICHHFAGFGAEKLPCLRSRTRREFLQALLSPKANHGGFLQKIHVAGCEWSELSKFSLFPHVSVLFHSNEKPSHWHSGLIGVSNPMQGLAVSEGGKTTTLPCVSPCLLLIPLPKMESKMESESPPWLKLKLQCRQLI